jgi:hypothetical protein
MRSMLAFAVLLAGCPPSPSSDSSGPEGPTYCAQNVGPVVSCEADDAGSGPVVQCGPQFPFCLQGNGTWSCCTIASVGGSGEAVATCPASSDGGPSDDAACPCVGCLDGGM